MKRYIIQELQGSLVWVDVNIGSWPIRRMSRWPLLYWSWDMPHATCSVRHASHLRWWQAALGIAYLKMCHKRWRRNRLRINDLVGYR